MSSDVYSRRRGGILLSLAVPVLIACAAVAAPAPGTLIVTMGGAVLTFDPATGDRVELSGSSTGSGTAFSSRPLDVVREESGDFVVSDFDVQALIRVDGTTGDRSVLASTVVGAGGSFRPGALEVDGDVWLDPLNRGTLLVWNTNASSIERVDPASGDRTVVASASVGSGTVLSAVQGMFRVGPGLFSPDVQFDLLVTDSNLAALVLVASSTGEREVMSASGVGSGPAFVTPRGIAMVPPPSATANAPPTFYVVDSGLDAVVEVFNPGTPGFYVGDRTIVSSSSVGSGPDFDFPYEIWPSPDGGLYVSDFGLDAVFHVDPATGDRTIVADAVTGSGPTLSGVRSFTAVPTATAFAWGFEDETTGAPPNCCLLGVHEGAVTVENADTFVGGAPAPEGKNVLYLTSGPAYRGDPAFPSGQSDESYIILPVYRGQNAPRTLRFAVDYLTSEGSQPDPTEVIAIRSGILDWTNLALLSMQTVNSNPNSPPSPFSGAYTALQGFTDGPITGPDGSVFSQGRAGYKVYEVEVDFPGVGLFLRVADEGEEGEDDTAMLVDDAYFLPEPGPFLPLALGGGLLCLLGRRRLDG